MSESLWLVLGLAPLVSGTSLWFVRPALRRLGVVDVPNHRSSHTEDTLRGGGVGPLLGLLIGGATAVVALPERHDRTLLAMLTMAAVAAGLIGLVEDLRGLRVTARAGLQLMLGAVLGLWLLGAQHWWVIALSAVAFAGSSQCRV